MTRYLVTVMTDNNPLRTHDVEISGTSAWQVKWLYRQLNPKARITAIRNVPEGR